MEKEIMSVLKYFSFFAYYPTSKEIYTFLQTKINKNSFNIELDRMVKQKLIKNRGSYTVGEYSIISQKSKSKRQKLKSKVKSNNETMEQWNNSNSKKQISKNKLNSFKFKLYIKLLSLFPQIKLVGLSGSISMMNAGENDDIDLFIITAKDRLFTGRFITVVLAQLFGLRRNRDSATQFFITRESSPRLKAGSPSKVKKITFASSAEHNNKVCLNLFFDESNLKVPKFKQTLFVGHEVLQMKPIIIKGNIYEKFLESNKWVQAIFPNSSWVISKVKNQKSKIQLKSQNYSKNFLIFNLIINFSLLTFNFVESILRKLQLRLINKHKTTEIITSTQLWFHPNDYNSFM